MAKKLFKLLGLLLLLLLIAIAAFAAFHPRAMGNMLRVGRAKVTNTAVFTPAEIVKGCASTPLQTAANGTLDANAFSAMQTWSNAHGGVGLLVLVDGKIAGEVYRNGGGPHVATQTMSMHKSVLAMLIGAAISDGIIPSADAEIGSYLIELKNDPRGKLTFRQLLSMSSGLKNPSMAKMDGAAVEMMLGHVSDAALSLPLATRTGIFNYNNANMQLAGMALSGALHQAKNIRYADYLSQKIWCPLGNDNAALWLEHAGGQPRYYAYLNAALRDWARVGELLRRHGDWNGQQLLGADWLAQITRPSPANANYGMGIWRGSPWNKNRRYSREVSLTVPQSEAFLADDVVYFDGFGGQRVYVVPSAKLVIVRAGETSMIWDESVLVNLALRGLKLAQNPRA